MNLRGFMNFRRTHTRSTPSPTAKTAEKGPVNSMSFAAGAEVGAEDGADVGAEAGAEVASGDVAAWDSAPGAPKAGAAAATTPARTATTRAGEIRLNKPFDIVEPVSLT
jgi:hypothetical protein